MTEVERAAEVVWRVLHEWFEADLAATEMFPYRHTQARFEAYDALGALVAAAGVKR